MKTVRNIILTIGIGTIASLATQTTAQAGIKCSGPYQLVSGVGKIASPYCEDQYLARIARKRGMSTSARAIRLNPFQKEEACHIAGHDIRVSSICSDYRFGNQGHR